MDLKLYYSKVWIGKMNEKKRKKTISITISEEAHQLLKSEAKYRNLSVSSLIEFYALDKLGGTSFEENIINVMKKYLRAEVFRPISKIE